MDPHRSGPADAPGSGGPTCTARHARCARLSTMQIGILGGTGPAGSGLGARLASVGFEVVIGSRSKYRAMEARRRTLAERGRTSSRQPARRRQRRRRRLPTSS